MSVIDKPGHTADCPRFEDLYPWQCDCRFESELLALAERCEKASEPDRELDRDIEIAIQNNAGRGHNDPRDNFTAQKVRVSHGAQPFHYEIAAFSGISLHAPGEYTASIDAAMALIPAGMILRRYVASALVPHSCEVSRAPHNGGWDGNSDHSFPLALCAAALRCRAAKATGAA